LRVKKKKMKISSCDYEWCCIIFEIMFLCTFSFTVWKTMIFLLLSFSLLSFNFNFFTFCFNLLRHRRRRRRYCCCHFRRSPLVLGIGNIIFVVLRKACNRNERTGEQTREKERESDALRNKYIVCACKSTTHWIFIV
jgi:hypothetical protein